jgi:hypothetical protein
MFSDYVVVYVDANRTFYLPENLVEYLKQEAHQTVSVKY